MTKVSNEVTIKEGDYVITEDFRLLQIKSIEERPNGNLRYNFTNGKFGLKDETKLGFPNNSYTKVDVSQCNLHEVGQRREQLKCPQCGSTDVRSHSEGKICGDCNYVAWTF